MKILNKFMYNPGGENETGSTSSENNKKEENIPHNPDKKKEHKSLIDKIKEALHNWSNKDQQDQQFDDTRV